MKKLQCDVCYAQVNEHAHWYNDRKPRNMYELNCIHESNSNTLGSNTYDGMIVCHECMAKLFYKGESEDKK